MKKIKDCPPAYARQLRHTQVQGRDDKFYKILTQQLYDRQPPPEFANFETVVNEVDEQGRYFVLVMPHLKRFMTREEALKHHEDLLDNFDERLQLPVKTEKHAPKAETGAEH